MHNLLAALPATTTVILVTHKASLLRLVDRVIVLDQGRVILDGARSEVLARLATPVTSAASTATSTDDTNSHHPSTRMRATS